MNDDVELVRGSGNIYRDFGHETPASNERAPSSPPKSSATSTLGIFRLEKPRDRPASPTPNFPASATCNSADLR